MGLNREKTLQQLIKVQKKYFVYSPAQYFASTMMIVGMSVVVTVIVLQFHHHDPQGGKMPKWVSDCIKQIIIIIIIVISAQICMFL